MACVDWQNFFGWGGEGLGVSRLWGLLFELWGNFVLKLSINTKIVLRI